MRETQREHAEDVRRYYDKTESRWGYKLILGGTKHFGWYDPRDSMWRFKSAMRRMERQLYVRLDCPHGAQVLDAGCGMGDVAINLSREYGLVITGVDLLDWNIEQANKRARGMPQKVRPRFVVGDYTETSFPAGSFDAIYTMETLVHVVDPTAALREFRRLLRPGGKLVLFEYSKLPDAEMSQGAAKAIAHINALAAMPGFNLFVNATLKDLVVAEGFQDVTFEDVTERMLPMLRGFNILARVPYAIARRLGKEKRVVNAMSAVEMHRYRGNWSYNIVTAVAPNKT